MTSSFAGASSVLTAMFAVVAVASAEETFTACLQENGHLTQGAPGERPLRECRGQSIEIHLQTRNNTIILNIELSPEDPSPVLLMDNDDISLEAYCGGDNVPILLLLAKSDIVSSETRSLFAPAISTSESTIVLVPQGEARVFSGNAPQHVYSSFTGEFVSTSHETFATYKVFTTRAFPPIGCRFSGEIRLIDLPELELFD